MNNVGATAVLLPAVIGLCRQSKIPPSQLLIPLSFGSLAGGMLTLIGTPSNLLVNAALHDRGLEMLSMFDFAPVGLIITAFSIGYMVLVGRRLLPKPKVSASPFTENHVNDLIDTYHLEERLFRVRIPPGSQLIGRSLSQSTLRDKWNLNVISVERGGNEVLDPSPDTVLYQDDILLLEGKLQEFRERDVEPYLEIVAPKAWSHTDLEGPEIRIAEVVVAPRSSFSGKTW